MPKDNEKWITAEELVKRLENNPTYQKCMSEKRERRRIRKERLSADEQCLRDELIAIGYDTSLDEMVSSPANFPENVVEILLNHLNKCRENRNKEFIVRALGGAEKPFDGTALAKCYDDTKDDESVRFAILNTIALTHPHSIDDWIGKICDNKQTRCKLNDLGFKDI